MAGISGRINQPVSRRVASAVTDAVGSVGAGLTNFLFLAPVADHTQPTIGASSNGTDTGMNTRSRHNVSRAVSSLRLVYSGWNWAETAGPLAEKNQAITITVRASIETGAGVMTPVYFSGSRDGVLVPGADLVSDAVAFTHLGPVLDTYPYIFVRTNVVGAGVWNLCTTLSNVARPGEGVESGTSITDKTTSGTIPTAESRGLGPTLVLNGVRQGSRVFACLGDSIVEGNADALTSSGGTKDIGFMSRALSGKESFVKLGSGGDKPSLLKTASNRVKRTNMVTGVTHAIVYLGINDIRSGVALATVQADLTAVWTWLSGAGVKVYACTIGPKTTSTDSWATTANQTLDTFNSNRTALNDWIRTTPSPLTGYFEIADVMETARNSGLWNVTGSAFGRTSDGLHPQTGMHVLMAAVIVPANIP